MSGSAERGGSPATSDRKRSLGLAVRDWLIGVAALFALGIAWGS
jgi:hypothetical protein